jgi:VCBS repeat-containing protein
MIKIQILSKASNQVLASFELMEGEMKEFSETEVLALFKEEATIEVVEGEGLGLREEGDMVFLFSNGETLRFRKYYPLVEEGRIAQADIQGIEVPAPDVVSVDTDSFDLDEDDDAFDLDIEEREGRSSSDPSQSSVAAPSPALALAPFFVEEPGSGDAFVSLGLVDDGTGELGDPTELPLSRGRIVDDFYSIQLQPDSAVEDVRTKVPTQAIKVGTNLASLLAQNGPLFSRDTPFLESVETNDTYEDVSGRFPVLKVARIEKVPVRNPESIANRDTNGDFDNTFTRPTDGQVLVTGDPEGEFTLKGKYGQVWVGRSNGEVVYQIESNSEVRAALFGLGKDGYVQDVFRAGIRLPNFDVSGKTFLAKPEFAVRIFGINDELNAHGDQPLWPADKDLSGAAVPPNTPVGSNTPEVKDLRVILVVERASAEMDRDSEPVGPEIHLAGRDLIGTSAPANSLFANDIDADLKVGVIRVTQISGVSGSTSLVVTAPGHGLKKDDLVALDGLVGSSTDRANELAGKPLSELNTQFEIVSVAGDTFTVRVATAFGATFTLTDPANGGSGMVAVIPSAIGAQNLNPLDAIAGTSTLVVYAPDHRLIIGDTVVLRGITGTVGGVNGSDINGLRLVVTNVENGGKFNVSVPGKVFNDSIPGSVTDLLNVGGADVTLQKVGVFGTSGDLTAGSNERPADLEWVVFPLKSASTITGAGDVAADNEAGVQTLERTTPTALTVTEVRATNGNPEFRVTSTDHGLEIGDRVTLAGLPLSIGGVNLMTDGGNVRTFTVTGISGLNQVLITEDKPTPVTAISNQTAGALVGAGMTETAVLLQGQFGQLVFNANGKFVYIRNTVEVPISTAQPDPKDVFVVQQRDEANLRMQELRIQIPLVGLATNSTVAGDILVGGGTGEANYERVKIDDVPLTTGELGFTLASDWTGFNVTEVVRLVGGAPSGAPVPATAGNTITIEGVYGTLTVNRWSGHYTYVLNQKSALVEALTGQEITAPTDKFQYTVFDGNNSEGSNAGALFSTAVLTLTIRGSNDSPALSVTSSLSATGAEDGIVVLTGGALADGLRGSRNLATILSETLGDTETLVEGDPDDGGSGLIYTLDAVPNAASEGSIVKLASAGGAVSEELGLNATFTHLDVTQGLIGFRPVANFNTNPEALGNTPVKVTLSLSDGREDGSLVLNGIALNLTVTAVNDRPVLSVTSGRASYTENELAAIIDAGVTVVDVDDANVTGATVTISAGLTLGDVLGLTESGGVTGVYTAGTGTLVLSGTATKAVYETVLRSVTFVSTSEDPTSISATRTITFAVTDQNASLGPNGVLTGSITRVIDVTAVNDAPVLVATATALAYSESAGRAASVANPVTAIDPNLALSDVDDTQMAGATVTIASGLVAGDVLGFANQNGISGSYNAGTGVLTLSGTASVANYQAALRSVTYSTTSDNPTADGQVSRTIQFAVTDANSDGVGAQTSTVVTRTIDITAVNDAPDAGGNFTVTNTLGTAVAIIEEDAVDPGAANIRLNVATLADPDSALPSQVRIVSVAGGVLNQANGDPIVLGVGGTLLTLTSGVLDLRFTPTADRDVNATFEYVVVDSSNNVLNSAASTATISITPVNDSPVLADTALVLGAVTEDAVAPVGAVGTLVSSLVGGITDPDTGATKGIAITNVDSTNGTLFFSLNGGTNWTQVNAGTPVSDTDALLLTANANTRLYFQPNPNFSGSVGSVLTMRAWDTTSGTAGDKVTTVVNGGLTAFSTTTDTVSITVNPANDAPVLADTALALVAIAEDAGAPVGVVGTLVSSLTGGVSDADAGALQGIAITNVDATNGALFFSLNNGTTWSPVGAVSNASALLLAADANTRLYFQPNANFNGAVGSVLTMRAWDTTSGTAGSKVTTASNGGATAFSTATDTVSITVNAVNDAPVLADTALALAAIDEDAAAPVGLVGTLVSALTGGLSDVDSGASLGIAITNVDATNGALFFSLDNGANWTAVGAVSNANALLLAADANTRLYFQPNSDFNGSVGSVLTMRGWDTTSGTAGNKVTTASNGGSTAFSSATDTVSITVSAVNDAPVLNFGGAAPDLSAAGAAIAPAAGITVTDVELSALSAGSGDFRGASLVVRRDLAVVASDTFTFAPIVGVTVVPTGPTSGDFQIAGSTFASFNTATAGQVTVTFAVAAAVAIPGSVVNSVMQALLFDNNTVSNGDSVVLQYTFSDGNSGAQGSGGVGTFVGTRTITVVAPVVLDLDGDGLNFVGANSADALRFDVTGDGVEDSLAWVKSGDGALVYDADGDGKVSHRSEFVFTDWGGGRTDLEALAANFDSNSDGQLTDLDADWSKFKIWQDLDSDGIFGTGELVSLDGMGILGLNLATSGSAISGLNDVKLHGLGTFEWADGSAGTLGDAAFAYTQGVALPPANEILNIDHGGVAVLPEIPMMTSIPMMGPAPTGPSPVVASHTGSNESSTVTTTPASSSSGDGSAPPSTAPLDDVPVDAPAAVV